MITMDRADTAEFVMRHAVAGDVPAAGAQFGVTLEPAGGSKQPTTTPVLLLPMQA